MAHDTTDVYIIDETTFLSISVVYPLVADRDVVFLSSLCNAVSTYPMNNLWFGKFLLMFFVIPIGDKLYFPSIEEYQWELLQSQDIHSAPTKIVIGCDMRLWALVTLTINWECDRGNFLLELSILTQRNSLCLEE